MFKKERGTYEISEAQFDELRSGTDDTICLEYDEHTGVIKEDGWIDLDQEDELLIGKDFLDSFIDSGKDIAWGRNDERKVNYELTRWNSKKSCTQH